MILDLNPLPYKTVLGIIKWCVDHKVDTPKCLELCNALSTNPPPNIEWTLDIPERYVSFFLLAFPWTVDSLDE